MLVLNNWILKNILVSVLIKEKLCIVALTHSWTYVLHPVALIVWIDLDLLRRWRCSLTESNHLRRSKIACTHTRWLNIYGLVFFINAHKLFFDVLVIWLVLVLQLTYIVENIFDFLDTLSFVPQQSFWMLQASLFNIFDFIHSVFFNFSPDKLLFKEIQNDKV